MKRKDGRTQRKRVLDWNYHGGLKSYVHVPGAGQEFFQRILPDHRPGLCCDRPRGAGGVSQQFFRAICFRRCMVDHNQPLDPKVRGRSVATG
jgi:hypothetical protein